LARLETPFVPRRKGLDLRIKEKSYLLERKIRISTGKRLLIHWAVRKRASFNLALIG
jgi:hypothetical protein